MWLKYDAFHFIGDKHINTNKHDISMTSVKREIYEYIKCM